jgi:hypothetical protein
MIPSPWTSAEISDFLEHYFYSQKAFLISQVITANAEKGEMSAVCDKDTEWLVSPHQRGPESRHPRHVSGSDLIMLTASLGSLHAYFFHHCKWHEGWVGFGNRMQNVEFHQLAKINVPLMIHSKELRVRRGTRRTLLNLDFKFTQDNKLVFSSNQTALFVKEQVAQL